MKGSKKLALKTVTTNRHIYDKSPHLRQVASPSLTHQVLLVLQPGLVVDLLLLIVGAPVDAVVGLGGGGGVAGGVALLAPERHLGRGDTHLENDKMKNKIND